MKVADGLEILQLSTVSAGRDGIISPVLLWDEQSAILVDAGLPGQAPSIKEAIEKAGVPLDRLKKVVITHHHLDHIGSLRKIQQEYGRCLEVLAHVEEKPYIEFEKSPLKVPPEKAAELMPEIRSRVDVIVSHGDELRDCGGIKVLHTPGHTPGHICLYLRRYRLMIAGDALSVVGGELMGPHPRNSHDPGQARRSLSELQRYDIDAVICYHGGLFTGDIGKMIMQMSEPMAS
jgi:glyoxylase-like metal-dependent hydrolase (beta-lactamase superfamily II)